MWRKQSDFIPPPPYFHVRIAHFLSKPNPNSNSIQLGLRLDFVFPLSQEQEEEEEEEQQQKKTPKSNLTLIGFDSEATKSFFFSFSGVDNLSFLACLELV